MSIQLTLGWSVAPVPTDLIFNNPPLVVGILAYAYALLQTDATARDLQSLTVKITEWSGQPEAAVENVLRQGLGLTAKRLYQEIPATPLPNVTARKVTKKTPTPFAPITSAWLVSLNSIYSGVDVPAEHASAAAWYAGKGIPFSQSALLKWLDRSKERASNTSPQPVAAYCEVCNNTQMIMGIVGGIPTEQDCPACCHLGF